MSPEAKKTPEKAAPKKTAPKKAAPAKKQPAKAAAKPETPKADAPKKETPKTDAPKKETPAKSAAPETPPTEEIEVVEEDEGGYQVKAKPELDDARKAALQKRAAKQAANPAFRRQEWFRYKKLGGKDAGWRRPRGIHSKMRRHYKYRPPVVSIGYRTPTEARGLHPSGFEEVLVYRPEDLEAIDPKTQAARIGGTVGGRKAGLIQAAADQKGVRILNRRDS